MGQGSTVLQPLIDVGYEIAFLSHAEAILTVDFPAVLEELAEVLGGLTIPIEEIIGSGGGETKGTQRLRRGLAAKGWIKRNFRIDKTINGVPRESISHEIDHVRNFASPEDVIASVAMEIEWNNKDPFFDRDLENFKRLHAEGGISAGVIVTRGPSLQAALPQLVRRWVDQNKIDSHEALDARGIARTKRQRDEVLKRVNRAANPIPFREAWTSHFVGDKFGVATTHWSKLQDRVKRGVGNPCPLLLIGIPDTAVTFGEDPRVVEKLLEEGAEELAKEASGG
ncbi:MAG: restriction endonuclease [Pseudomonadota bacterium]|nr:restriction endonuclease [Pseudomonadota bacterium]